MVVTIQSACNGLWEQKKRLFICCGKHVVLYSDGSSKRAHVLYSSSSFCRSRKLFFERPLERRFCFLCLVCCFRKKKYFLFSPQALKQPPSSSGSLELTSSPLCVCRWEPQRLGSRKQPASGCPSIPLRRHRVSLSDGTAAPRHQGGRPPAAHQPDENIRQLRLQGGVWGQESGALTCSACSQPLEKCDHLSKAMVWASNWDFDVKMKLNVFSLG